ncbi:hypothetical protein [Thalassobacillus hwangdonensis]|uniref:DUF3221 domain-containing protein n=1 Tax=Thalassobacillus hwangdonensis TaxID=546108 RepID=A0ABW3L1T6_9BACI
MWKFGLVVGGLLSIMFFGTISPSEWFPDKVEQTDGMTFKKSTSPNQTYIVELRESFYLNEANEVIRAKVRAYYGETGENLATYEEFDVSRSYTPEDFSIGWVSESDAQIEVITEGEVEATIDISIEN